LGLVLMLLFLPQPRCAELPAIKTVFVILMENMEWVEIEANTNAPYINGTLLPRASYCRQYTNRGLHPSLPNYLWLESGTNFGIFDNLDPSFNHQSTTNHLSSLLDRAGISWRAYQEDIGGTDVPLTSTNLYTPRHNPFVYFDDVTGTNDPANAYGIAHIRPYSELGRDLTNKAVARYNFITPNLCNGMHDLCPPFFDSARQGDYWLERELPRILASPAYDDDGAVFITWDEGEYLSDGPIGMILLSRHIRGAGYISHVAFTHSSLLRTLQEIFQVRPLLGDAAGAEPMTDLFDGLRINSPQKLTNGLLQGQVTGTIPGSTNLVHVSSDLVHWDVVCTNVATSNSFTFTHDVTTNAGSRFYRALRVR